MSLSAIIITKNEEEDDIERCIESAQFADEIIVVASEHDGKMNETVEQLGATLFVRSWPGYGPQKNFGAAQATGQWLLFLDADEEVSDKLADEMQSTIRNANKDYFWVKISTVFLSRPLKRITSFNPRLFKKSAGSWTSAHVHEQVQTNSGQPIELGDKLSDVLVSPLYHHSHRTVAAFLQRLAEYSALDAQRMASRNTHRSGRPVTPTWYLPSYAALRQFFKLYFYRLGLLDGYAGFLWSALSARYEYETCKKYLLLKQGKRSGHEPVLR